MNTRSLMRGAGRALISAVMVFAAWSTWLLAGNRLRVLCGMSCVAFTLFGARFVFGRSRRAFVATGIVAAVLALSPVEVALALRPGLPAVVPVQSGLPSPRALEAARRGDIVLNGCVGTGLEPRWVLVL